MPEGGQKLDDDVIADLKNGFRWELPIRDRTRLGR